MDKVILYVHGKGGSSIEAENYRNDCPDFDIIGVDYYSSFPSKARDSICSAYDMERPYRNIVRWKGQHYFTPYSR